MDFKYLRRINLRRCIEGFKHQLNSWSIAEWTNALCGEAGEAANVAKKIIRHRDGLPGNVGKDQNPETLNQALGEELADVVIYADLTAAALGLDLEELIKYKFNKTSDKIGSDIKL